MRGGKKIIQEKNYKFSKKGESTTDDCQDLGGLYKVGAGLHLKMVTRKSTKFLWDISLSTSPHNGSFTKQQCPNIITWLLGPKHWRLALSLAHLDVQECKRFYSTN